MSKGPRMALVAGVLLCLAAGNVPQSPGDTLTVTRRTTKLRSQKRVFAPAVADLKEGDRLKLQGRDGAWLQVAFDKVAGWLHESDASARADVRLSGQGVRENYSASESSAARKGFNPQVEREYRNQNSNLEAAFALVDQIQARPVVEADVKAFLEQGGLLREAGR